MATCPNGYFTQQTNPSNSVLNHNKCVSQCGSQFGDPSTASCVSSCPFPKWADTHAKLCVIQCTNASEFMQITISNSNRVCVSGCETGQFGNPFTFTCSTNSSDCPDGYFADSHVNMCVANCTVHG